MTTLDNALDEREKLTAAYRIAKRQQLKQLCADPEWGDRLHKFIATLPHFTRLEHADRMRQHVENECRKWLREAPEEFRFVALEAIDERCTRIRMRAGLVPFDDPMPGEEDNLFRECKKMLGL